MAVVRRRADLVNLVYKDDAVGLRRGDGLGRHRLAADVLLRLGLSVGVLIGSNTAVQYARSMHGNLPRRGCGARRRS